EHPLIVFDFLIRHFVVLHSLFVLGPASLPLFDVVEVPSAAIMFRTHPASRDATTIAWVAATFLIGCQRVSAHPSGVKALTPNLGERFYSKTTRFRDLKTKSTKSVRSETSGGYGSDTTGFRSSPMAGMSTRTSSPGRNQRGGFLAAPTPDGVPVETMSPGSSVNTLDKYATSSGILKIRCFVLESCRISPLISIRMSSACGSGISSFVTIHGPIGAKVSKVLPISHWLVARWKSRALTSFTIV